MGLNYQHGKTYFSPQHPHWIWEQASLLSSVLGTLFPGIHWPGHVADSLCPSSAEIIEGISSLPTHLHGVFLLPNTPSWCSVMTHCHHPTAEACF
jgi:hypothetical protein